MASVWEEGRDDVYVGLKTVGVPVVMVANTYCFSVMFVFFCQGEYAGVFVYI